MQSTVLRVFWVVRNVFVMVTHWPVEFLAFIVSILKTVSPVCYLVRRIGQYKSLVLVNFLKWLGTFFNLIICLKPHFITECCPLPPYPVKKKKKNPKKYSQHCAMAILRGKVCDWQLRVCVCALVHNKSYVSQHFPASVQIGLKLH